MRKQTKQWTTKDGIKIRICDMTDSHLLNTIKMLEREGKKVFNANLQAAYAISASFTEGSIAEYQCETDISWMEQEGFNPFDIPLYENLYNEAQRRSLL